jgi:hypothetical protein
MNTATWESVERELEMAAECLSVNPAAEAESAGSLPRLWDVWTFEQAAWRLRYRNQVSDTRDNALAIRDVLKRQWGPWAQSQGIPLLVRCFTLSPTTKQWVECQNFSG